MLVVLSLRPRQGMTVPCMVGWVVDRSVCWLVDCMSVVFLVGPLFFFGGRLASVLPIDHRTVVSSWNISSSGSHSRSSVFCARNGCYKRREAL